MELSFGTKDLRSLIEAPMRRQYGLTEEQSEVLKRSVADLRAARSLGDVYWSGLIEINFIGVTDALFELVLLPNMLLLVRPIPSIEITDQLQYPELLSEVGRLKLLTLERHHAEL